MFWTLTEKTPFPVRGEEIWKWKRVIKENNDRKSVETNVESKLKERKNIREQEKSDEDITACVKVEKDTGAEEISSTVISWANSGSVQDFPSSACQHITELYLSMNSVNTR